jgi:hypothetical protein
LAFRALSVHDAELMKRIVAKVLKRLRDPDPAVVGAALIVSADVVGGSVSISIISFDHAHHRLEY